MRLAEMINSKIPSKLQYFQEQKRKEKRVVSQPHGFPSSNSQKRNHTFAATAPFGDDNGDPSRLQKSVQRQGCRIHGVEKIRSNGIPNFYHDIFSDAMNCVSVCVSITFCLNVSPARGVRNLGIYLCMKISWRELNPRSYRFALIKISMSLSGRSLGRPRYLPLFIMPAPGEQDCQCAQCPPYILYSHYPLV